MDLPIGTIAFFMHFGADNPDTWREGEKCHLWTKEGVNWHGCENKNLNGIFGCLTQGNSKTPQTQTFMSYPT